MKPLFFSCFILFTLVEMTCNKRNPALSCEPAEVSEGLIDVDTVSSKLSDRNDVPAPPLRPWRKVNPDTFNECQSALWKYFQHFYPIAIDNYWNYNIYGIDGFTDEYWPYLDLQQRYVDYFSDTITRQILYNSNLICERIDTTFFQQTIGRPTCTSVNVHTGDVNYFYYFKIRWRSGPCPNIYDEGVPQEARCDTQHFDYCFILSVSFSATTGNVYHLLFG